MIFSWSQQLSSLLDRLRPLKLEKWTTSACRKVVHSGVISAYLFGSFFSCSYLLCRLNPPAWRKRNWKWKKQLCITSCLHMWPTWIGLGTLSCECLQGRMGPAAFVWLRQTLGVLFPCSLEKISAMMSISHSLKEILAGYWELKHTKKWLCFGLSIIPGHSGQPGHW